MKKLVRYVPLVLTLAALLVGSSCPTVEGGCKRNADGSIECSVSVEGHQHK